MLRNYVKPYKGKNSETPVAAKNDALQHVPEAPTVNNVLAVHSRHHPRLFPSGNNTFLYRP